MSSRDQSDLTISARIEDLKRFIVASSDAEELCKKVLLWLIDQTNGLSQQVLVWMPIDMPYDRGKLESISREITSMNSNICNTYLVDYMRHLRFRGIFCSSGGESKFAVAFSLGVPHAFINNIIEFDLDAIEMIDLSLYSRPA